MSEENKYGRRLVEQKSKKKFVVPELGVSLFEREKIGESNSLLNFVKSSKPIYTYDDKGDIEEIYIEKLGKGPRKGLENGDWVLKASLATEPGFDHDFKSSDLPMWLNNSDIRNCLAILKANSILHSEEGELESVIRFWDRVAKSRLAREEERRKSQEEFLTSIELL